MQKIMVKYPAWNEKPEIKVKINMGCYVMEPKILNFIPKNISHMEWIM